MTMSLRHTTTARACAILLGRQYLSACTHTARKMSTGPPSTPNQPKRQSPYRLFTPTSFLSAFAPLHVQGWRLLPLPNATDYAGTISDQHADLQDRRIVRIYEFSGGGTGWQSCGSLFEKIHQASIDTSHHPGITISPASDYIAPLGYDEQLADDTAYVVEVSMNTHTPYAPVGQPKDAGKMRPGVTMKDVTLAEKVEEMYRAMR